MEQECKKFIFVRESSNWMRRKLKRFYLKEKFILRKLLMATFPFQIKAYMLTQYTDVS